FLKSKDPYIPKSLHPQILRFTFPKILQASGFPLAYFERHRLSFSLARAGCQRSQRRRRAPLAADDSSEFSGRHVQLDELRPAMPRFGDAHVPRTVGQRPSANLDDVPNRARSAFPLGAAAAAAGAGAGVRCRAINVRTESDGWAPRFSQ